MTTTLQCLLPLHCTLCLVLCALSVYQRFPAPLKLVNGGLVAGGDSFLNIGQYAMLSTLSQQQVATYHLVKQHFCWSQPQDAIAGVMYHLFQANANTLLICAA